MPAELHAWVALGDALGRQAWPAFAWALPLAMLLAAALGAALRRPAGHRGGHGREPRLSELLRMLVLGFAAVLALAWGFAQLAQGLGDGRPMGRMDDALSIAIGQHTPQAVREGFALFTRVGDPWPMALYTVALAAWLWRRGHQGFALGWLAANAGNALMNYALKHVFERLRPVHDTTLATASGYSFPSGHTSGAMVFWGMAAYLALRLAPPRWQLPMLALATGMVLSIAASRVFLQVHYLTDVMAGLCSGAAWLAVCIASVESARHRRRVRHHRAGINTP